MENFDIEYMTFHKDDPMVEITNKNFDKMVNKSNGINFIEIKTSIEDYNYSHCNRRGVLNDDPFNKLLNVYFFHKLTGKELYSYCLIFPNIFYYRNKSWFDKITSCPKLNILSLKQKNISEDEIRFYFVCE
jgi:hypothetical protein